MNAAKVGFSDAAVLLRVLVPSAGGVTAGANPMQLASGMPGVRRRVKLWHQNANATIAIGFSAQALSRVAANVLVDSPDLGPNLVLDVDVFDGQTLYALVAAGNALPLNVYIFDTAVGTYPDSEP